MAARGAQPRAPGRRRRWRSARSTSRCGISRRSCSACRCATLLGRGARRGAGLRQRRLHQLQRRRGCSEQLGGWVRARDPAREDEGRPRAGATTSTRVRAARAAIGDDAELFVDANGAYARKQALALGRALRRAGRRELVRGAGVAPRTSTGCGCCATAHRPGWRSRPASTATTLAVLPAHARRRRRRRAAGRRAPAAAASPACSRSAALCQAHQHAALGALRAATARASRAARSGRCATWSTSTTTRASSSCSSTARSSPRDGRAAARPRPSRPRASSSRRATPRTSPHEPPTLAHPDATRRAQPAPRPRTATAVGRHGGGGVPLGVEIYVNHYGGSFGNKWMWTPVVLSPAARGGRRRRGGAPSAPRARGCRPCSALYAANGASGVVSAPARDRAQARRAARGAPTTSSWVRRCWRPDRWPWSARIGLAAAVDAPGALSRGRRFRDAGHLPNSGPTASRPTPPVCRASAAGSRRSGTAATPTTTCSPTPATGIRSPATWCCARVEHVPRRAFFTARRGRRACARSATSCSPRTPSRAIPVMSFVDAKLHDGRLDGFQHVDMPDDRETWRLVAHGLDEAARARGAERFAPPRSRCSARWSPPSPTATCTAGCGTGCPPRPRGRSSCARSWPPSTRTRGRGTRSASAAPPTRAATCAWRRPGRRRARRGAARRSGWTRSRTSTTGDAMRTASSGWPRAPSAPRTTTRASCSTSTRRGLPGRATMAATATRTRSTW